MRLRTMVLALAVLPVALGGCGSPAPEAAASATPDPGAPWVVVNPGSATPGPGSSRNGSPHTGLPPASFLPTTSACAIGWPEDDRVLIPMIVTPAKGSLEVRWPAKYGPTYRVAAVDQRLVSGAQPQPVWKTVPAGSGCTVSATITGLTSGAPYIVWLDAPDTPRGLDGSRSLYSGKSGVVKPL
jgi:hypothetical protein